MDMMVIVWAGLGLVIFALSFILPKRKEELDEDTKKFAGEQIRDILNKEIAGMQSKLDDVVADTIEESSSQTERALEKITNEKIMAINEYSDTVIEDINNNHKEVLFLYDMLNDKHVTIRNTVTEVERITGEVTQTAKDIEISAREAVKGAKDSEETVKRAMDMTNHAEKAAQRTAQSMEMDMRHIVEDMIRNKVEETMEKTAVPMIQERVDSILEDAALLMEQQPKILIDEGKKSDGVKDDSINEAEILQTDIQKEDVPNQTAAKESTPVENNREESIPEKVQPKEIAKAEGNEEIQEVEFVQGIAQNAPQVIIEEENDEELSYYVVEPVKTESSDPDTETAKAEEPKKISEIDMAPEDIRELEKAVAFEVMQEAKKAVKTIEENEESEKKDSEENQSEEIEEKLDENQSEEVEKEPEASGMEELKTMESRPHEAFMEPENNNSWLLDNEPAVKENNNKSRNNNEKILSLHKEGMSDVAIARELGLGVGEVKLVIDLFKGM